MENNKKLLLSVKDLHVKFRVRGRILTAIRGISLDIYENESIAIVGESGSGKTTIGRAVIRVNPCAAGEIDYKGVVSFENSFKIDEKPDTPEGYEAKLKEFVAIARKMAD